MGSMCASLFGSSASTSYSANPQIEAAYNSILSRAAKQSTQPYPQYTPSTAAEYANYNPGLVAPMDPNQVGAGQSIAGLQGYTSPYFQAATGLVSGAATPMQMQQFSQGAINQYMNPYMNDVVKSAVANINQTNAQQQQQVLGNSVQQGAFGGDRAGIAQAELARQQNLANNATISNLLGQGYSQAQGEFNTQQQTDLTTQLQNRQLMSNAALNLANLGTQGQQAALQQAQAQYGYGTAEQQQQQANLSTAYQQYMQQQAYPYQQLSYYAGLASGAAPALGGTTTGYSPTVAPAGALMGGLSMLGGLTNPGSISSSNPYSAMSAGLGSIGSLFGLKDGGRANYDKGGRIGYATGGNPTDKSIIDAYDNYQQVASTPGASPAAVEQAYQTYLSSLQSTSLPWENTPAAATTPSTTKGKGVLASSNFSGQGFDTQNSKVRGAQLNPLASNPQNWGNYGEYGAASVGTYDQPSLMQSLGNIVSNFGANGPKASVDPVKMSAILNGNNPVAVDSNGEPMLRSDGTPYPNTTSGMSLQEYANQFANGDTSQVMARISTINGAPQIDYSVKDVANGLFNAGAIPAEKLNSTNPELLSQGETPVQSSDGGVDLAASKSAANPGDVAGGGVTNANAGNQSSGVLGTRSTGFVGPYGQAAAQAEANNTLPSGTVNALGAIESNFNPNAVNGQSVGLGQLQPKAASEVGVTDRLNPDQAIQGMADYAGQISQGLINNGIANPTIGQIGLAYNQGLGGFNQIMSADQNAPAASVFGDKFNNNKFGLPADATVGQWAAAAQAAYQNAAVPTPSLAPPSPSLAVPLPPTPGDQNYNASPIVVQSGLITPNAATLSQAPGAMDPMQQQQQQQASDQTAANNAAPNAGIEGHGPSTDSGSIGLDRSVTHDDSGVVSHDEGDSMGGRGNSPSVGDSGGGGEGDHSEGGGGNKRGGLILAHKHHYDSGGYVPFQMQYGLPDQASIKDVVQSDAGTGVGSLSPTLQALAASGVLSANKGGRIHAANGTGISDSGPMRPVDESDPESTGAVPDMGTTDATANQPLPDDFRAAPDPSNVDWDKVKLGAFTMPTVHGVLPGIKHEYDPDLEKRNRVFVPVDVTDVESRKNAGTVPSEPITSPPVKTQPIIPRTRPDEGGGGSNVSPVARNKPSVADLASTGDDQAATTQQNASTQNAPANIVAQDTTRTMSDAAQPGFGYVAPPPVDMRQMAAFNFGANLLAGGDFGTNLARAGNAYANAILSGQSEQRANMTSQAEAAKGYAQANQGNAAAGLTRAQEKALIVTPNPFGGNALVLAGTPENPQYKYIDMPQPDQAGGQQAAGAAPAGNAPSAAAPAGNAPAALGDVLNEKAATLDQYANSLKKQVGSSIYSPETVKNLKNEYQGYADETNKAAQIANISLGDASTMAHDLVVAQQNGWGTMGAGSAFRLGTIRAAAAAARVAGYTVSDDPVVASQELQKIARLMANQQAGSVSHNAAARTIDATEAALPGTPLEPEAANKVFTSIMRQNVMARDAQQATNYFGGKTARMGNPEQAIQAAYPPDQYNREQNALQDLMSPDLSWKNAKGKNVNLVTELMDGHYTRAQFDDKVSKYYPDVKHLSRWLVN